MANYDVMQPVLNKVLHINTTEIAEWVAQKREQYPDASNTKLASMAFNSCQIKVTTTGFLTGLPTNVAAMVPLGIADAAMTLQAEVEAVAKAALVYNPDFFADEDAKWTLLAPIFGISVGSQALGEIAKQASKHSTKACIKKVLKKEVLKTFKEIVLQYFGKKVTQKSVITKTLPVVGAIVGGGWNYAEVAIIKKRTLALLASD